MRNGFHKQTLIVVELSAMAVRSAFGNEKGAFEMVRSARNRVWMSAIAASAMAWVSACAANQSADGSAARPGSFQAIMAVRAPGVYGVHLAAADQAAPASGSAEAPALNTLTVKSPGVYAPHSAAADSQPAQLLAKSCQPGSFAAVMSAKLPPNARPGNPEIYKDCR